MAGGNLRLPQWHGLETAFSYLARKLQLLLFQEESGDNMKVLFKEKFKVLAKQNDWTIAHAEGYIDGQISRKRGKVPPTYSLVGRDEYCLGFRAGYFASDRKLPRVKHDVK